VPFVPVTGPATFRRAEPPREGVVEFSDERRTVSLPMRAALPVLAKARSRDDLHPSVGLLSSRRRATTGGRRGSTRTTRTGSRCSPAGRTRSAWSAT